MAYTGRNEDVVARTEPQTHAALVPELRFSAEENDPLVVVLCEPLPVR
jgi:hypothetical protein